MSQRRQDRLPQRWLLILVVATAFGLVSGWLAGVGVGFLVGVGVATLLDRAVE